MNVLEVDQQMQISSLMCPDSVSMFLDFQAVLPSVSHEFLLTALREVGIPAEVLCF